LHEPVEPTDIHLAQVRRSASKVITGYGCISALGVKLD